MSVYLITFNGVRYEDSANVRVTEYVECPLFTREEFGRFIRETAPRYDVRPDSMVIEFFGKFEETADIRLSAGNLMELQRVAAAQAIEAFGEFEENEREYTRLADDARAYADEIRSGARDL